MYNIPATEELHSLSNMPFIAVTQPMNPLREDEVFYHLY